MYGALSGEGPVNDPVINAANSQDSGSGSGHHAMNPNQFKGMMGEGGAGAAEGGGAAAGGAAAGAGEAAELLPLLAL